MAEFRLINGNRGPDNNNSKLTIPNAIADSLIPIINEQRKLFFDKRISEVKDAFDLRDNEITDIWRLFLAGEHPEYTNGKILELLPEMLDCQDEKTSNEVSWCFHNFKWIWSLIWKEYQLENFSKLCARFVLKGEKKDLALSKHPSAEEILIAEITLAAKKVFKEFQLPKTQHEYDVLIQESSHNIYELDIASAKALSKLRDTYRGDFAPKMIDFLQSAHEKYPVEDRARSWKQPLFFHKIIATIAWNDSVKKRIELLHRKPPALTYIVNEQVHRPMCNGAKFNKEAGKIIDHRGNELAIIDMTESGKTLPSMNIEIIQKILRPENIKVLSTVNAHRLLRWEIQTVTKQFVEGMIDARSLKVYGGYQELANLLGIGSSKKAAEQLRDIIVWQAAPRFYQPNGRYGNMLSFDYTPSGRGRQAVLQLVLGNMMLPHYVYELLNMPEACVTDRRLIPIVDMPPLIGRSNDQGSQPSYQMEILVEMRKGAKEFATKGCVLIPKTRLGELAEKAGLSRRLFLKVIDRWLQDGTDSPAFLKMVEEDRYALGNHFRQAQDFIIEAGKKEITMSKAGKRSIAKRNSGIFKT